MEDESESKNQRNLADYLKGTKESLKVFTWIFTNLTSVQSMRWVWWMLGGIAVMILMQTVQPFALSLVFNGLAVRDSDMGIWGLVIFSIAITIQKIAQRSYEKANEHVFGLHSARLDDVVTGNFNDKSLAQHAHESTLLARPTIDKGRMKTTDLQRILFLDGSQTILNLLFSLAGLFLLSMLAGTIMMIVMAIYVAWSIYLNSELSRVCTPLDRRFRRLAQRRCERMDRVERVKVTGMENREVEEMAETYDGIISEDRRFWLWFIDIAFIRSIINVIGLITILAFGAWLVWNGDISIGLLYPLYSWSMRVSENIWRLGDLEKQVSWNLPAIQSMIRAMELPPAIVDKEDAMVIDPAIPHHIEFESVSHTYPGDKDDIDLPAAIHMVSFTIEPGEKVALIGPSGTGKSTIMKKLLRFDDPTSGRILIDGIDLRDIAQSSWKDCFGYIPQQSMVFDGTIRYNLTFALCEKRRKAITDDELWDLMRLLQIDFGERLTKGLDTIVGKDGIKLSGGQAQRLMIGAAVIKNPRILIIDEATSSLDSTTEKQVQHGLQTILKGTEASALIVAHRLSTVRDCDKFVVLRTAAEAVAEGLPQVEAIAGSFEELYEMSPTFRQLADDQDVPIGNGIGHGELVEV
jgi:ABC-type multidrug transport system fused ATPase/permease subunit